MKINLLELCKPKQWKTLLTNELVSNGKYYVYGANGIIGKYTKYNHEKPTILITCRGATCGNIHLSKPYSYINGNAMSLDDLDESKCLKEYLYYFLKGIDLNNLISGTAQPQITIQSLKNVYIKIYSLDIQKKIVSILSHIDKLIENKKIEIEKCNYLIKSQFVEMFGDPLVNDGMFEMKLIKQIGKVVSGATPKTNNDEFWNGNNIWVTPAELNDNSFVISDSERKITDLGVKSCAVNLLPKNTVILSSRAPIGKTAIAGVDMYCNQGFKNIIPSNEINSIYLYELLKNKTEYLNSLGRGATFKEISKEIVENIKIKVPPIELQNKFAQIVEQIDKQKFEFEKSIKKLEELQAALMQEYFE